MRTGKFRKLLLQLRNGKTLIPDRIEKYYGREMLFQQLTAVNNFNNLKLMVDVRKKLCYNSFWFQTNGALAQLGEHLLDV